MKPLALFPLVVVLTSGLCAAETPDGKPQRLVSPDRVPDGLAKSDWSSIHAAHSAWRHAFQPVEGGWQAHNPGQQWTTRFDTRGFLTEPKDGGWQWGLELKSYGFAGHEKAIAGPPTAKAAGQRLSYDWDATVQEWWINDPRGLEHGFTIAQRPPSNSQSSTIGNHLSFTLAVRGTLRPQITADSQGVDFEDSSDATVITYAGLKVWDADGKILPSHFVLPNPLPAESLAKEDQPSLRLLVDDRNARYPLTIDPVAQQAYVKPNGDPTTAGDFFGCSVAVAGDTVVVGARQEGSSSIGVNSHPNENAVNSGAAYVFIRSGTTWTQQAYLKASNTGQGDLFGGSVAIAGDTVVVGAQFEDSSSTGINNTPDESATESGAAYVFIRSGTIWTQQAYLKAGNTGAIDLFGVSVAVSGDTVVVGARLEDSNTTGVNSTPNESGLDAGAAYVFTRSGTTWTQQAYLKAGNTGANDNLGNSVAVAGDTVIVGAYSEDSSTTGVNSSSNEGALDAGAAYVFFRSGTTWTQQAYLKASNTGAQDNFGQSVAIAVDTVVVTAIREDSGSTGVNSVPDVAAPDAGAAYVFTRSGTIWSQQAYLKPGNTGAGDQFGSSVAIESNTVVIGAIEEDSSTTGINSAPNESAAGAGAAYVFFRNGTTWSQHAYLKASNTGTADQFGCSVAVVGDTAVVGALGEDTGGLNSTSNNSVTDSGAAYVFTRSLPTLTWTQQAFLKTGDPKLVDHFGSAVAVSGDTVVVGAFFENSSTTGVNSVANENATEAGAAYVFIRSGATWTQQAYLKASNTGAGDNFGFSVAIAGDTVVIGARYEDSSSTGVNSTPDENNSAAGAAYVFTRSGTTWTQQAYLKPAASFMQAGDSFGWAVAIAGDTVIVGAYSEDGSASGVNGIPDDFGPDTGAAYVFIRSGITWTQQAYLKASNPGQLDSFGSSVAIAGDTAVVGANFEDSGTTGVNSPPDESAMTAGAAYVFNRIGTTWSQQAYLKASNTGADDLFGRSVAIAGDTLVVGASGEDSSTTGVNSTPNEGAGGSGAAYVFTRSGTTWNQHAYLKASNPGEGDAFGLSVAIAGEVAVVGANGEDSSTTGVNSIPNESTSNAGAAYVFVRNGTTWNQHAYLKASNPGAGDAFGASVAVAGDTVIIAASNEDSITTGVNSTPNDAGVDGGAAYIFVGTGEIAVEQPAGIGLVDGGTAPSFATALGASGPPRVFTIWNAGIGNLTGLAVAKDGTHSADYLLNPAGISAPLVAGGSTTFTGAFSPAGTSGGLRTAALHIASDETAGNPFDINLAGQALSYDDDTDGDGMNDASESQMATFGFDWQASQPSLVTLYNANANGAGYFTPSQVQALHVDVPLIQRNTSTGEFTLTIGVRKSTDLLNFTPFPMTDEQTLINGTGKLEFKFTSPDNAAFFRLETP